MTHKLNRIAFLDSELKKSKVFFLENCKSFLNSADFKKNAALFIFFKIFKNFPGFVCISVPFLDLIVPENKKITT